MTHSPLTSSFGEKASVQKTFQLVTEIDQTTGFCTVQGYCDEHGVCQGEWLMFDTDGNLFERITYKDGVVIPNPNEFLAVTDDKAHSLKL